MKINSFFSVLLFVAAILFAGASLSSCGDGDDNKNNPEGGGGDSGGGTKSNGQWYIELVGNENVPTTIDFMRIWIDAQMVFHHTPTLAELRKQYTEGYTSVIHIIDDNTLEYITPGAFCEANSGSTGGQILYRVNTSSPLGTLALYANGSTPYTYEKIDNKLYVPLAGEIYTITSFGLWEDGGDKYYSYNPETAFYTIPPESYNPPID